MWGARKIRAHLNAPLATECGVSRQTVHKILAPRETCDTRRSHEIIDRETPLIRFFGSLVREETVRDVSTRSFDRYNAGGNPYTGFPPDPPPQIPETLMTTPRLAQIMSAIHDDMLGKSHLAKPRWLVRPLPVGPKVAEIQGLLSEHGLHTVCEEARCPNRGECWSQGEATLMILGDTCSRGCRFCDVKTGSKTEMAALPLDILEPAKVANTVQKLALTYAVITSVDRDELPDQGADHWARVIQAVKHVSPNTVIDVLVPDFRGDVELIQKVVEAGPHVLAHNIETVRRLTPTVRDARCGYDQTLDVLRTFKKLAPNTPTKSGIMTGHGETREEVIETLRDLRAAGVDFVTIGQYLRPSNWHLEVQQYWHPNDFVSIEHAAWALGFKHVVAGPFVRSSYRAWEVEKLVRDAHGMPAKPKA